MIEKHPAAVLFVDEALDRLAMPKDIAAPAAGDLLIGDAILRVLREYFGEGAARAGAFRC